MSNQPFTNLGFTFDATQVAPAVPFEIIPAGMYPVVIEEAELTSNSKGNGILLNLTLSVIEGPYLGRKIFDRLNIKHENPQAQDIAQRALSAIAHSIKKLQFSDVRELINIPLAAKVTIDPARTDTGTGKTYEARNEVKGYKEYSAGLGLTGPAPTATGPTAPLAPNGAAKPNPFAPPVDPFGRAPGVPPAAAPAITAPTATPTTPPAPPKRQRKAPTPAPVAPPSDTRLFLVYPDPNSDQTVEWTGDQIREAYAKGMPKDSLVWLKGSADADFADGAKYGLFEAPQASARPAPPQAPATPPAAPATVPAGNEAAPWLS